MSDYHVFLVTAGSEAEARKVALALLEKRLAACVNLLPMTSLYHWEGKIEEAAEVLLLIKSTAALRDKLEAAVKEHHSYQVPEFIGLPIVLGSADYLKWIVDETTADQS